jgi:RimJ/RimL family protein N-acetyltransferase
MVPLSKVEYLPNLPDEIAARIGKYVARIVEDGDTIQVGYGSVPNAIMAALGHKKHLAQHAGMTAINSALEIDLTGQASAESIGHTFYGGIGGQADFMRGALLAPGGKSILALPSTSHDGESSRIVPFLHEGAGATLNRGDLHYVVTEFGMAHIHGKNIRERAMDLIAMAHSNFRAGLVEEARRHHLAYHDQEYLPGERGEYPEHMETRKSTRRGQAILLRPVRISDEPLIKDFFYSLSDRSMYRRFLTPTWEMSHERLQNFVVIDYTKEIIILAVVEDEGRETLVGLGEYYLDEERLWANVAFAVRDSYQNRGVGTELLAFLVHIARRQGLFGLTAEVLKENEPMLRVFDKVVGTAERTSADESWDLRIRL